MDVQFQRSLVQLSLKQAERCVKHESLRDIFLKQAQRIEEESPQGTRLIVYGMFDDRFGPVVGGLTLEHKFRTPDLIADFYVFGK